MSRRSILLVCAAAILLVQATYSRVLTREPFMPSPPALSTFPAQMSDWSELGDEKIPSESLDKLSPDDFMARVYNFVPASTQVEVFVAYYKTQLRAKNAHDPKLCLPGAGWDPVASSSLVLHSGSGKPFPANYYRIRKGADERVVLYWFQTYNGVYTLEQQLKAHRVWDAAFANRTDMALVRLIVPVTSSGVSAADANVAKFAPLVYTQMLQYFPTTKKAAI